MAADNPFKADLREPCFVLGNGPSLSGFDLHRLTGYASLGMNAAYRHWDRIGWYPTYYSCLDDELIATHKHEIVRLVDDGRIRQAFVTAALLDDYPERVGDPRFVFLDQFISYWHEVRGAGHGIAFEPHPMLTASNPDKLTTGSHAVRYAAWLGYRTICVMGIDLSYQERIPEAMGAGGIALRMASTPAYNPNYFFNDYQRAGDRFNVPNPPQHGGQLHFDSFAVLVEDAATWPEPVRLINASRASRIFEAQLTEYVDIDELLADAAPDEVRDGGPEARAGHGPPEIIADMAADAPAAEPVAPVVAPRPGASPPEAPHPRVLILDMTLVGDGSATGELKRSLFETWPQDRLMQVHGGYSPALPLWTPAGGVTEGLSADAVRAAIRAFDPQVVLYRPVPDAPALHAFAMDLLLRLQAPLAVWIMDDWPASLDHEHDPRAAALAADWPGLVRRAQARLSISDAMSEAFAARYGAPFTAVANGVDPAQWPLPPTRPAGERLVRYAGGLSDKMGLASLVRLARAVETLADEGFPVRLEILTKPYWRDHAGDAFAGLARTSLSAEPLSAAAYREWLGGADVLAVCYNFDERSLAYTRHSMANKLPECLASGAAVFAHGPREVATLRRLAGYDCAILVDEERPEAVLGALRDLLADPARRADLADRSRRVAFAQLNLADARRTLAETLREAATAPSAPPRPAAARRATPAIVVVGDLPPDFDPDILGGRPVIALDRPHSTWPEGWRPDYLVAMGDQEPVVSRFAERLRDGRLALRRTLVRESLVRTLGEPAERGDIQTLEGASAFHTELSLRPVSNLSHAVLWACALRYGEVILIGVPPPAPDSKAAQAWTAARGRLPKDGLRLWSVGDGPPGIEQRPWDELASLSSDLHRGAASPARADHASTP